VQRSARDEPEIEPAATPAGPDAQPTRLGETS
jgi:hypothetical protein